jgi:AcrR family transcriptional regulator
MMPPKQKFSKEDILEAAFSIARERGIENLNARNIAGRLKPVFRFFENMEELKTVVFQMAERYHAVRYNTIKIDKKLWQISILPIYFALYEPNLFRLQYQSNEYKARPFLEIFDDKNNEPVMNVCVRDGKRYAAVRRLSRLCFLICGSTPTAPRRRC